MRVRSSSKRDAVYRRAAVPSYRSSNEIPDNVVPALLEAVRPATRGGEFPLVDSGGLAWLADLNSRGTCNVQNMDSIPCYR